MLKIYGMNELLNKLERMQLAPNKIAKKALKEAGNHVLESQIKVARTVHKKYSTGAGVKELNVQASTFAGNHVVDVGINSKSNWDKVKGLYFNHYGFYNKRTGTYVAGSGWINIAYKQSVKGAYTIVKNELLKELDL